MSMTSTRLFSPLVRNDEGSDEPLRRPGSRCPRFSPLVRNDEGSDGLEKLQGVRQEFSPLVRNDEGSDFERSLDRFEDVFAIGAE